MCQEFSGQAPMNPSDRIYIANHDKMPGRAFARILKKKGFRNLILKTAPELDLLEQASVRSFFRDEKPDHVILTSVKSGGIQANIDDPAGFLYDNLTAQNNVIHSAFKSRVKKLLYVVASCVYPKSCPQPMKEDYILTGPLEPTSEPYSLAKIAGMKMCQYYNRQRGAKFISVIPATIFGPDDDFDADAAHVIPALIRKFHDAKEKGSPSVTVWGSGNARREFIYADDMVDACLFLMKNYNKPEPVNIGTGTDMTIRELAQVIKEAVGFKGELKFDRTRPEGAMRKLLDISKITVLGWKPKTDIRAGIQNSYAGLNS
jgi:GDP-L-fucose synthase